MAGDSNGSKVSEFIAVFVTSTVVAIFLVCLRLWIEDKIVRIVGLND